jgi:hypothetical protein
VASLYKKKTALLRARESNEPHVPYTTAGMGRVTRCVGRGSERSSDGTDRRVRHDTTRLVVTGILDSLSSVRKVGGPYRRWIVSTGDLQPGITFWEEWPAPSEYDELIHPWTHVGRVGGNRGGCRTFNPSEKFGERERTRANPIGAVTGMDWGRSSSRRWDVFSFGSIGS